MNRTDRKVLADTMPNRAQSPFQKLNPRQYEAVTTKGTALIIVWAGNRAKENLYLTYPSYLTGYNAYFHQSSRFLEEIDNHKYLYINDLNNFYGNN